jgi:hypothetical protein
MRFNEKIKQLADDCMALQSEMMRITQSPYDLATQRDYLSECQEKYKQTALELGALLMDWLLQDVQAHGERFIYHPRYEHLSSYQNHIDLKDIFDFQDQLKQTQQAFSIKELTETTQLLEDSKIVIQTLNQEMNQILDQLNEAPKISQSTQNFSAEREEDFVNQVLHENIGDIPFIKENVGKSESFYDDFLVDPEELDPLNQILLEEHLQELALKHLESAEDLDKELPIGLVESMISQMPLHDSPENPLSPNRLNLLKNALKEIEDAVNANPIITHASGYAQLEEQIHSHILSSNDFANTTRIPVKKQKKDKRKKSKKK